MPFGITEYRLLHVIFTKFHQILSDHVKFHLNLTGSLCVSLLNQDIKAVLARLDAIPEEQRLESGVSASAVMDLIGQVKEATRAVMVPADLLETLLTTAEQALWRREWTARDDNHPVPESVARRLADVAKVRALLKN